MIHYTRTAPTRRSCAASRDRICRATDTGSSAPLTLMVNPPPVDALAVGVNNKPRPDNDGAARITPTPDGADCDPPNNPPINGILDARLPAHDNADLIKLRRAHRHEHSPVVPVQRFQRAVIEPKLVGGGEFAGGGDLESHRRVHSKRKIARIPPAPP